MALETPIRKLPTVGGLVNPRVSSVRLPGTPTAETVYGTNRPGGTPAAPRAPAAPTFKWAPGQLDAQGENEMAAARYSLQNATGMTQPGQKVGDGAYDIALQRALHQTAAQRIMAQQQATQGERRVDSNAAARGIYNSGIRLGNRGEINAALTQQMAQYAGNDTNAQQDYERQMAAAVASFLQAKRVSETNASTRAWNAWLARYGGN